MTFYSCKISNTKMEQTEEILKIIDTYSKALDILDKYDHKTITKPKGQESNITITYEECLNLINDLRFKKESELFARERNKGLEGIIGNVYQSIDGKNVYPSSQEKVANLFYLIVKNHVFIDGNKRIGATIFIYALNKYNLLIRNGENVIDNNTLVTLTLLIAQSKTEEKDIMIALIMNFLI